MIQGLKQDGISQFTGKAVTKNLAESNPGSLLSAKNVLILSDGQLRRAPGYTLVTTVGSGPVKAFYDFQRDVDHRQFVFVEWGDAATDVLVNGDFSLGASGWVFQTGWALGSATGVGPLAIFSGPGTAAVSNTTHVACAAGQTVTASCMGLGEPGATGTAVLRITFFDSSNAQIGSSFGSVPVPNSYVWTSVSITEGAPSGAAFAIIDFAVQGSTNPLPGPRWAATGFSAHVLNTILAMNADGSEQVVLSTSETGTHQWVSNSFAAYSSDGHNAWRYVDVAGTLTKYQWGITAPTIAPAISLSAGTLTLTYGRTYVYCFVSKYTDSLGIQRVSVSAPSPVSAHTGPIASQVVLLFNLQVSADPQVNYKWIFAVSDSPFDTSATYYFAAEIPNTQTSWGDSLIDDALDTTRLAPFDNNPAPPAPMLAEFQNRIVAANGSLMQLSGYSEITLGIPEEAWPASLFFNLPSGKRTISGLATMQQGTVLIVSTQDYFYAYTGYDAITFTEQDRVGSPGFAGTLARVLTPEGLMYLGANQSVRVWRGPGGPEPTSISDDNAKKLQGTYAMEDIDPDHIAGSQCLWYDFGPMNLLVVFARTSDSAAAGFNLMQLWSFVTQAQDSSGVYGSGSGVYTQLTGTYLTDKLPSQAMTAAGSVNVGFAGQDFIFMGDAAGNVYRWPDGFTDNGNQYYGIAQHAWHLPNEGKSRYYWADLVTDRADSALGFQVYAATADAPDQGIFPIPLTVQQLPSPVRQSGYAIRASMNAPGTATGKYCTFWISFPRDNADAVVRKVTLASRPINAGIS